MQPLRFSMPKLSLRLVLWLPLLAILLGQLAQGAPLPGSWLSKCVGCFTNVAEDSERVIQSVHGIFPASSSRSTSARKQAALDAKKPDYILGETNMSRDVANVIHSQADMGRAVRQAANKRIYETARAEEQASMYRAIAHRPLAVTVVADPRSAPAQEGVRAVKKQYWGLGSWMVKPFRRPANRAPLAGQASRGHDWPDTPVPWRKATDPAQPPPQVDNGP